VGLRLLSKDLHGLSPSTPRQLHVVLICLCHASQVGMTRARGALGSIATIGGEERRKGDEADA